MPWTQRDSTNSLSVIGFVGSMRLESIHSCNRLTFNGVIGFEKLSGSYSPIPS